MLFYLIIFFKKSGKVGSISLFMVLSFSSEFESNITFICVTDSSKITFYNFTFDVYFDELFDALLFRIYMFDLELKYSFWRSIVLLLANISSEGLLARFRISYCL